MFRLTTRMFYMDIVTLCIAVVISQPLIVYLAFYKDTGLTTKKNEFYQSFLVIPPSFAFFYLDQYWYALSLLAAVTLFGLLLAKMVNHKASHPIVRDDLISFGIAWLIIFGIGHFIASLFTDSSPDIAVTPDVTAVTIQQGMYSALSISLLYLAIMLVVFFVRVLEKKYITKEKFSDFLLLICSVIGGAIPVMGDYFMLSMMLNFFILFYISGMIIRLDGTGPSSGAVGFIFGYLFMMGAGVCLLVKGGAWLFG